MFRDAGISAANFSLDNIRRFCSGMGNPQLNYTVIHIAGTNGKGTTAYLLEQIYAGSGCKTGVFTSPHLLRYNERVRVNGLEISDNDVLHFFQSHAALLQKIPLTYFEISTALAFWYFDKRNVEIAIVETGLGGRLDSTNIVQPAVSVITSIGLDHQNILGDSIEEIAAEKAGIIKEGKPVIVGNVDEKALKVIREKANAAHSEIFLASKLKPEWDKGTVVFESQNLKLKTQFKEQVNKWNVACAYLVQNVLQSAFPVSQDNFNKAVESFRGAAGRFEKLHPEYNWYFSGSHNQQAMESSVKAVEEMKALNEVILVFSAMKDKVNTGLTDFYKAFNKRYFVQQEGERAAKASDFEKEFKFELMDDSNAENILNQFTSELVIFTGSFYFYPIVKRWISKFQ